MSSSSFYKDVEIEKLKRKVEELEAKYSGTDLSVRLLSDRVFNMEVCKREEPRPEPPKRWVLEFEEVGRACDANIRFRGMYLKIVTQE